MRAIHLDIGVGWDHKIFQFGTNLAYRAIWQLKATQGGNFGRSFRDIRCFAMLRRQSAKICLRAREPDTVLKRAMCDSRTIGYRPLPESHWHARKKWALLTSTRPIYEDI